MVQDKLFLGYTGEFLLDDLPQSKANVERFIFIDSSYEMLERAREKYLRLRTERPGENWPEAHFIQV